MVKVIPARIEDGRIVADEALPDASAVESVSVVLNMVGDVASAEREAALARLVARFAGVRIGPEVDVKAEYGRYLQERYG